MSWELSGTYFEGCSCDSQCPCNSSGMTAPADTEHCRFVVAFHVDSGQVDGLDISGRSCVLVGDSPALMSEGGWRVGMFVDDGASPEEMEAVSGVFSGALGGPMAAIAPAIGEFLGAQQAPITYTSEGGSHSLKVGDAIDLAIEEVVHPGSDQPVHLTGAAGLPWGPDLAVATSERHTLDAFGMTWDGSGKNGNAAPISWSA